MTGMIKPFIPRQVSDGVISYGLGSYGYDIRIGNKFKVFQPLYGEPGVVDPKSSENGIWQDFEGDVCYIPPNSFALGVSLEMFNMPRDVTGLVVGKSTYARCGLIVNITPLEAGWSGYVTMEISNTTPLPAKVYANEGIAQVLFFQSEPCSVSYADRKGKYQHQRGITLSKV
jgi:dCTP deaminase